MVQNVTEPLLCQATAAVCGQVYIKGRCINRLPPKHTHALYTNITLHTATASPAFLMLLSCGALKRSMLRFYWNHLQVLGPWFCSMGTLERKCHDTERKREMERKRQKEASGGINCFWRHVVNTQKNKNDNLLFSTTTVCH